MNAQAARQNISQIVAAVVAVAATYAYFLLFAQFGFLEAARMVTGDEPGQLRLIMTVMGGTGIAASLFGAWSYQIGRARLLLTAGFAVCGSAAVLTLVGGTMAAMVAAAAAVGAGTGFTTVVLAAVLRLALGLGSLGKWIGLGTGLGYGFCNLPAVFSAKPATQAGLALVIVAVGVGAAALLRLALPVNPSAVEAVAQEADFRWAGVARWTLLFFVLVGLDSAAFYIIQHTEPLKAGMWSGDTRLWLNAAIHVGAAVLAGWALDRRRLGTVVATAALVLILACGLVADASGRFGLGVTLYVTAVSVYSVALVYYPARSGRVGIAATVYAVAGWFGSAMGIGLAENVHRVPVGVSVMAGVLVAGLLAWRQMVSRRGLLGAATVAVVIASGLAGPWLRGEETAAIVSGRAIFVREGCIHCHSQYVRPGTADELRWGPVQPLESALSTPPPLLGNRRQGPDLQNVANRRNREWNRVHLVAPRLVTPGSRMPAYADLFAAGKTDGDALLAYLDSLGAETTIDRIEVAQAWTPASTVVRLSESEVRGQFSQWCAGCHGPNGLGDGPAAVHLGVKPRDLTKGEWLHMNRNEGPASERLALARVIKFGIPGTAMAGREYLDDEAILSLSDYIQQLRVAVPR